jgi:hypothetical protein
MPLKILPNPLRIGGKIYKAYPKVYPSILKGKNQWNCPAISSFLPIPYPLAI